MTKAGSQTIDRAIIKKRLQLKSLRDEIEDLTDYLDVLEARARDVGKVRLSQDQVKKRYGLKSHRQNRSRNGRKAA
jgi:hypothetical protein